VPVEPLLEPILIQVMPNETNRSTEDKETVETAVFNQFSSFFVAESPTASQHIYKAHCNAAVNIENQVGSLLGGHLLHSQRELKNNAV
jgi:hypothetical protein